MKPGCLLLLAGLMLAGCAVTGQPMGPAVQAPFIAAAPEAETGGAGQAIITPDGHALPLRRWLPEGAPKAAMLALHGFNDYSVSFELPASFWADAGIAVYAYDQRGFGAADQPGIWPGSRTLVADARTATRLVAGQHPGLPLFVLGESMGGAVALLSRTHRDDLADAPAIDGLILVAPAIADASAFPLYQRLGLRAVSLLAPGMRLTGEGLELQPSDNIEVLREMWYDPLTIKDARVDTLKGLLDLTIEAAERVSRIAPPEPGDPARAPVLMIFGGNEQVIPLEAVAALLGPARAQWRAFPAWRLGYYEQGYHMLLRDLEGESISADVLAWMHDRRAPLPSGADAGAWDRLLQAGSEG